MSTLKRSLRWIIPLAVLLVLAICFVVAPMVGTHAATVAPSHGVSDGSSGTSTPNSFWHP
jgi:Na+-translocating ferredoxin:NAD+ oxidoreductase RnfD subunit